MADVDLIVPTIKGREESLERCLESFKPAYVNPIIIHDAETCGAGWLKGLELSRASYVALVADDIELASDTWPIECIEVADSGFLPCPRVYTPERTIESQGGDMNALGHLIRRHQADRAPVDFTTVPFCTRKQIDKIGCIATQYGCDTYISYRGRQLGYETVLVHGYDLIHHQEQVGRGAGMNQNDRDAMDTRTMAEELAKHG